MSDKAKTKGKLSKAELMRLLNKYNQGQRASEIYRGYLIRNNLLHPALMESIRNRRSECIDDD